MKSILFVCVGNACRSQMSEGFARAMGPKDLVVYSAGSHPAGFVAREAIVAMQGKGIDISEHYSKGLSEIPAISFDYLITMGCGDACPLIPAKHRLDWKIPDPIGRGREYFNQVRDDLERRIRELIESPTF